LLTEKASVYKVLRDNLPSVAQNQPFRNIVGDLNVLLSAVVEGLTKEKQRGTVGNPQQYIDMLRQLKEKDAATAEKLWTEMWEGVDRNKM
jgi:hypothetical protein